MPLVDDYSLVQRAEQEIADARKLGRRYVTPLAAAHFLHVSDKTLRRMRAKAKHGEADGPPFEKDGEADSARVRYLWPELEEWSQRRGLAPVEKAALERLDASKAELRRIHVLEEVRELERKLARARERAQRAGVLAFGFADVTIPEPWVVHGDRLAGHLFDLDDDAQVEALDQGWVASLSLADALQRPWHSSDERTRWHQAFIDAMNQGIGQAEAWQAASRDDVLASAWDEVAAPPVTLGRNPF